MLREFPWLFAAKLSRNEGAVFAIKRAMQQEPLLKVTIPNPRLPDPRLVST